MDEKELINILKENKGLICSIISKYAKYYEFDDLYQVATIGVMKAYNNYHEDSGTKFTTYAYKWILSEVVSFVNNSKLIKTSRKYNTLYKKILEARNVLTQRLMKEPSTYELSLFLELDESIINDILKLKDSVCSLDATVNEDGKTLTLLDSLSLEENNITLDNLLLKEGLEKLTKDELELIKLRYFQEKTQSETAKYLNTNQVQVSRNETKILKKLKKSIC